jgi:uncharacterized membrane protein
MSLCLVTEASERARLRRVADDHLPMGHPQFESLRTARLEAFSDGVFAIAITLLVLDLTVPPATASNPGHDLLAEWPTYLAYIVSFASIGNAWITHAVITDYLVRADSIVLRLNLLLLFFVSLLPFPTHMLSNFLDNPGAERVGVTVYGLNLLAMAGLTSLLWRYSVSQSLVSQERPDEELRRITAKVEPGLLSYIAAIVIGLIAPRVAVVLYLAIAIYLIVPYRAIRHWLRSEHTERRSTQDDADDDAPET